MRHYQKKQKKNLLDILLESDDSKAWHKSSSHQNNAGADLLGSILVNLQHQR